MGEIVHPTRFFAISRGGRREGDSPQPPLLRAAILASMTPRSGGPRSLRRGLRTVSLSLPRHATKDIRVIERAAAGLIKKFPTLTFTKRSEVQSSNGVGRVPWGYGPAGAEAVITGIDVLVMKGDKIAAVYVFPDSPKK